MGNRGRTIARRTTQRVELDPEERKNTSLRLPPSMKEDLRRLALDQRKSLQKILREVAESILKSASDVTPKQPNEPVQERSRLPPAHTINYVELAKIIVSREPSWPGWRPGTKQKGVFLFWRRVMLEFIIMLAFAKDGLTAQQMIDGLSLMTRLEAAATGQKMDASLVKDRMRPRMEYKTFFERHGDVYRLKSPIDGATLPLGG